MKLLLISSFFAASTASTCFKQASERKEFIKTAIPSRPLSLLPDEVDWRTDADGVNMASLARNQHVPNYCGACWSFAATSSLNDRMKIASKGVWPETDLAPQVILNCDLIDNGCHGGDPITAFQYIHEAGGIPDETCQIYTATGHDTGNTCNPTDICRNCDPTKGCFAQPTYKKYGISEYGLVNGTEAMMNEISARGPIACTVAVPASFQNYTGGIYQDTTGDVSMDHSIEIMGYGTENGVDFWHGRNSWGTYWGEKGFFRIIRGINNLGVEANCQWAVPLPEPTIVTLEVEEEKKVEESSKNLRNQADACTYSSADACNAVAECRWCICHALPSSCHTLADAKILPPSVFDCGLSEPVSHQTCRDEKNIFPEGELILSPLPQNSNDVPPAAFDWRSVKGAITASKNQHIPQYCGSCWAQAVTSALSHRIMIAKNGTFPEVQFSAQYLINCNGGGTCQGGNPASAYSYIKKHGITDNTCVPYSAKNLPCGALAVCETCHPTADSFSPGVCESVPNHPTYTVSEYGSVSGADNMKKEIVARGPISCGISVTAKFEAYTGGIYSESKLFPLINHEITVVGYGVENGVEYWIGQNSWGTYWGESGFFRIQMHTKNLGIESDCSWGVPTVQMAVENSDIFAAEI